MKTLLTCAAGYVAVNVAAEILRKHLELVYKAGFAIGATAAKFFSEISKLDVDSSRRSW